MNIRQLVSDLFLVAFIIFILKVLTACSPSVEYKTDPVLTRQAFLSGCVTGNNMMYATFSGKVFGVYQLMEVYKVCQDFRER